jgi:hypothetical protein
MRFEDSAHITLNHRKLTLLTLEIRNYTPVHDGPVSMEETENVLLNETKIELVPVVWEVLIPKLPVYLLV